MDLCINLKSQKKIKIDTQIHTQNLKNFKLSNSKFEKYQNPKPNTQRIENSKLNRNYKFGFYYIIRPIFYF